MISFALEPYLLERRRMVDDALDRHLPAETTLPVSIHGAMRYAVFAGGKRLRPILVLAGCEAAGGVLQQALPFACAVEMIHTYSLVHDDLPALDDDDLRRGRPTVHKAFDEATAILTGDALLTRAFEAVLAPPPNPMPPIPPMPPMSPAHPETHDAPPAARRLEALAVLATAAGTLGMIGGQVDDLEATGGTVDEARVRSIHERKTGALLRACPVIGGILAGAPPATIELLSGYGADLGLAFQIVDDILDIEGSAASLGKSAGKDAAAGKLTYPAAIGIPASREIAARLAESAHARAAALGDRALPLAALATFVVARKQ